MDKQKLAKERLDKYYDQYRTYTDKLSLASRQLAFAEGGVFWIFGKNNISFDIATGLFFLVIYFIFDASQYYLGMRNYEALAAASRKKFMAGEYEKIRKGKVNKKLKKLVKLKLLFLAADSVILAFSFLKIVLCKTNFHWT